MGKFFIRCRIQMKFRLRVCLKRWNDQGKFELDRVDSKNNIAENLVALGHETHNRSILHAGLPNLIPNLVYSSSYHYILTVIFNS